jgi:hypothetical protein
MVSKTDKANGKAGKAVKPDSWTAFAKANPIGGGDGTSYQSPPQWQASHGIYLAGQAEIDEADALAIEMTKRWGTGRLRLLVSPEWRLKFDRQSFLFNQAMWHGTLEDVIRESRKMCAAWRKLGALAEEAGAAPLDPEVWEVDLPDGSVAVIVRDDEAAEAVDRLGRKVQVYTLGELANLIHGFPSLVKAKQVFPGATVEAVRRKIGNPLDGIADTTLPLDEVPF